MSRHKCYLGSTIELSRGCISCVCVCGNCASTLTGDALRKHTKFMRKKLDSTALILLYRCNYCLIELLCTVKVPIVNYPVIVTGTCWRASHKNTLWEGINGTNSSLNCANLLFMAAELKSVTSQWTLAASCSLLERLRSNPLEL